MNFSYLAIKLPNFKSVDEKVPELEPRVSHSFVIKIVLRKKLLKVLAPLKLTSGEIFQFQNLAVCMRCRNNFFAILKLYFWSIHMANNLILSISFGFKLNSNLKDVFTQETQTQIQTPAQGWHSHQQRKWCKRGRRRQFGTCVFVGHLNSPLEICEARANASTRCSQEKGNFPFLASASNYIHTCIYCSWICVYACVCVASMSTP